MSSSTNGCGNCSAATFGPGYKSPRDAFERGPREKLLFVTCPSVVPTVPDLLAVVDVDPESGDFCKIIGTLEMPNVGDELHHSGWNACSSCHGQAGKARTHLVLPCLNSSRIYAVDVANPAEPKVDAIVEPDQLAADLGVSFPHTAHCLADGTVMVSTLGDPKGGAKGDFVLLDGATFKPLGKWAADSRVVPFNYDFWYQPRRGLMLSTEWGAPKQIRAGFVPAHVDEGDYGHSVHVWDWHRRQLVQTIPLAAPEGLIPLEVRFAHCPDKADAFVGTALGSAIFHLWREEPGPGPMRHRLAATIPPKRVQGWAAGLEWMPALVTDILLSMDDRFLYVSCWLHGDVRQYDVAEPAKPPKLVGQCFLGGSIHGQSGVKVLEDSELQCQPEQLIVCGRPVEGGPQMLQLSLDGRRLYVTNSLYSVWDKQFYPKLLSQGSTMLQLDVDTEGGGGLKVNPAFRVDFGKSEQLPKGPYLAHEMRYPGGDCTSDIWT